VALLPYEDVLTLAVVSQSPQEKGLKQEPVRELVLESEPELAVTKQQHPYPRLQCSAFPTHTHTHTHTQRVRMHDHTRVCISQTSIRTAKRAPRHQEHVRI
jgi:hypothetical protein